MKDPRKTFGKAVSDIAENDQRIYILSADSGGSSGFKEFTAAHPDRYFEFGTSMAEDGINLNEGLILQKEGFGGRAVACKIFTINIQ